jgi:hypothetical protein
MERLDGCAAVGKPGERIACRTRLGQHQVALVGEDRRGLRHRRAHPSPVIGVDRPARGDEHRTDHLAADEQRLTNRCRGQLAADLAAQQDIVTRVVIVRAAETHGHARMRRQLRGVFRAERRVAGVRAARDLQAVVAVVAVEHRCASSWKHLLDVADQQTPRLLL